MQFIQNLASASVELCPRSREHSILFTALLEARRLPALRFEKGMALFQEQSLDHVWHSDRTSRLPLQKPHLSITRHLLAIPERSRSDNVKVHPDLFDLRFCAGHQPMALLRYENMGMKSR